VNLPKIINEKYDIPVYLKNDVKCSSLCEKKIGNLKEYNNALFLTLGTGIGGAYYYKDELMVPNTYHGMEIGHMVIELNGRKCRCGKNGCFEEYASMRAFRNKIREIYNIEDVNSSIALDLYHRKEKEDEMNNAIKEYIEYLSIGLNNLISILEPDAICIGGSFVHYEEIFMDKLKNSLKEKLSGREVPDILLAKYGNDAGIIGASMITAN
jgi:glucokinase